MRLHDLQEARLDSPDVDYELAGTTKAKTAAGEFSKITATVSGSTSAKFTKLAKKFKEIDDLKQQMDELKATTDAEAKQHIDDLFDAEDAAYTRYIDTVSLSITMSKAVEAKTTETSTLNIDGFVTELLALVSADLEPAIRDLATKHTKIAKKTAAAKSGRITTKIPEAEGSGLWNKVRSFTSNIKNKTMQFLGIYDQKLDAIASKYGL